MELYVRELCVSRNSEGAVYDYEGALCVLVKTAPEAGGVCEVLFQRLIKELRSTLCCPHGAGRH